MPYTRSRPFDSPLRPGFEKREQLIRRSKLSSAKARRHNRLDSLELLGGVSPNVDFRGGQMTVSQPQRDFANVFRCLQYDHGAGVAKHVGRDLFAMQCRAFSIRRFGVTLQNVSDAPPA